MKGSMMKGVILGVMVTAAAFTGTVAAQEQATQAAQPQQGPRLQVLGVGQTTCKAITDQVEKNQQASAMTYGGWVHGYLSAMNQVAMAQRGPQLNIGGSQSWNAMVGHCKNNPGDMLVAGANKLRMALMQAQAQARQKAAAAAKAAAEKK